MKKAEKEHMAKVAELGCYICQAPAQVHHIMDTGRRIGHFYTIPLCFNHHNNQTPLPYGHAVHKGTKEFEKNYTTQKEMLKATNKAIYGDIYGKCDPDILEKI